MKQNEIEFEFPCERDHLIPKPDLNITEEEKKRRVAEADAELKRLFEEREKYILTE